MKLTELNPKWLGLATGGEMVLFGVRFDCPCCRKQRLAIWFNPPIDPGGWQAKGVSLPTDPAIANQPVWQRQSGDITKDSFQELTVMPSINAAGVGHWHGYIKNGEVT